MAKVTVKLLRPYDREPGDHFYGEPFDGELDRLVGGAWSWAPARTDGPGTPTATIGGIVTVTLHEDGPELAFGLANLDSISAFVSAVATCVSAWAAARALRSQAIPERDAFLREGGTLARVGDIEVRTARNLSPDELSRLVRHLGEIHEEIGTGR